MVDDSNIQQELRNRFYLNDNDLDRKFRMLGLNQTFRNYDNKENENQFSIADHENQSKESNSDSDDLRRVFIDELGGCSMKEEPGDQQHNDPQLPDLNDDEDTIAENDNNKEKKKNYDHQEELVASNFSLFVTYLKNLEHYQKQLSSL